MAEQITTAEELDAASVGTVVRDARSARLGEVRNTGGHNSVMFVGRTGNTWATDLRRFGHLPLVVVTRPDAPTSPVEDREALAVRFARDEGLVGLLGDVGGEVRALAVLRVLELLAARSSQPAPTYDHPDCCDHAAAMENGHCFDCRDTGHPHAPDWPAPSVSAEQVERVESAVIDVLEDDESEGLTVFDLGVKIAAAALTTLGIEVTP